MSNHRDLSLSLSAVAKRGGSREGEEKDKGGEGKRSRKGPDIHEMGPDNRQTRQQGDFQDVETVEAGAAAAAGCGGTVEPPAAVAVAP